jgi:hypothetical protein
MNGGFIFCAKYLNTYMTYTLTISTKNSISNGELPLKVLYEFHQSHIILKQLTYFLLQLCKSEKLVLDPTI